MIKVTARSLPLFKNSCLDHNSCSMHGSICSHNKILVQVLGSVPEPPINPWNHGFQEQSPLLPKGEGSCAPFLSGGSSENGCLSKKSHIRFYNLMGSWERGYGICALCVITKPYSVLDPKHNEQEGENDSERRKSVVHTTK